MSERFNRKRPSRGKQSINEHEVRAAHQRTEHLAKQQRLQIEAHSHRIRLVLLQLAANQGPERARDLLNRTLQNVLSEGNRLHFFPRPLQRIALEIDELAKRQFGMPLLAPEFRRPLGQSDPTRLLKKSEMSQVMVLSGWVEHNLNEILRPPPFGRP